MNSYTKYILCLSLFGCSSENIGQQETGWKDLCKFQYTPIISDDRCDNIIHFTCLDGADEILIVPAEGADWIGTACYQELDKQYVYVCGVNDKNQAWVYCNK